MLVAYNTGCCEGRRCLTNYQNELAVLLHYVSGVGDADKSGGSDPPQPKRKESF